ncbi:MAG: LLM class flavin-dependent oxidoreductase [Rhodospirillaceae bacterium]|nr:MAG: LLM class flavin-dependent oxidoreductase [Rhodospirillaceae bacterium]
MDMAIQLPTKANSWEVAVRAEQLGFSHAWFYDTALLNAELFAAMAVAAVKTSKIKLCTGVMVPSNRLAPVAASGLATLNALAPGRIVFGVSTGFTARRAMGLKPITLARMCKYIEVVQGLLAGKMVDWDEEGGTHKIRFLNPDLELINLKDPIPLAISAFGPKARTTVAKYGAQWIGGVEHGQAELNEVRSQWAESGRDPKDLYTICLLGGRVLDEGEPLDSAKMWAQAGPSAAINFHYLVEEAELGSLMSGDFPFRAELEAYRKVYQAYEPADARYLSNHRGHLMFVRPDEKHLTGPLIKGLTMTGTKAELVERLRGVKALGFSQVQFHTFPGHENEMMERWADVMAQV